MINVGKKQEIYPNAKPLMIVIEAPVLQESANLCVDLFNILFTVSYLKCNNL
jgi:hypothetical protein